MSDKSAVTERGSRSIKEWCAYRGYSVATFYKMKKNGVAPRITQPPGTPPRITQEADQEWLQLANNLQGDAATEAAHLADSRRKRAITAASKAVESPEHVSKRKREGETAAPIRARAATRT
jgi:hypothetical protein